MPHPSTIVEWYGPYTFADVPGAVGEYSIGANVLCMALGDVDDQYRCSVGDWVQDAEGTFPLDIPEDLADSQFYLGQVISYRPNPGRTAAAWALTRVLQPARSLNDPDAEVPARLEDLPDHGGHYCMSLVSWFYDQDDNLIDPPARFPAMVGCNQFDGLDEWSIHPKPVSLVCALQHDPKPLPEWLQGPSPMFDREKFFGSRTVYYPGSGDDGHPVSLCARAHATHAFVYVDYKISEEIIRRQVHTFLGYEVDHLEEVSKETLRPGDWKQHIDASELPPQAYDFASVQPFALFVVLRRSDGFDDTHGPQRLAILFVGGDGYATFDALYCQDDDTPAPLLVVVQDHGFGDGYSRFGKCGLLDRIAHRCGVFPEWLLVGNPSVAWSGYRDTCATPERGGQAEQPRRLFLREGSPVSECLN